MSSAASQQRIAAANGRSAPVCSTSARRHRERRDQRDVDAAADDDDRHGEAEDAENGHVLQQRQHVVRRQEAGQEERETRKQNDEDREDDGLLGDPERLHDGRPPHADFHRIRDLFAVNYARRTCESESISQRRAQSARRFGRAVPRPVCSKLSYSPASGLTRVRRQSSSARKSIKPADVSQARLSPADCTNRRCRKTAGSPNEAKAPPRAISGRKSTLLEEPSAHSIATVKSARGVACSLSHVGPSVQSPRDFAASSSMLLAPARGRGA